MQSGRWGYRRGGTTRRGSEWNRVENDTVPRAGQVPAQETLLAGNDMQMIRLQRRSPNIMQL